ncbi:unnamed protein product [Linum tenue]|uniref:FBD domain-containing protein n=1 Tax=Linum tenue TaxID=586396 RepID=A0AAV0NIT8_9ROSI|nr:unnamed protein product [Linum tenue]CAI0458675.1 unnamed protein product [Linum tenue]
MHTPLLSELILLVNRLESPEFVDLLASTQVIAKGGEVPMTLPLHNLTFLNLTSLSYDDLEMKRVLNYLIMNSPNLRELTIKRFRPPSTQSLLESVTRPQSGCCLQRLKLFDIDGSLGTGVDLELVRFVLATAPLLLRIQIKPLHRLCSKLVIKFMKEVMQYKRVSREAVVIYDWNDEED